MQVDVPGVEAALTEPEGMGARLTAIEGSQALHHGECRRVLLGFLESGTALFEVSGGFDGALVGFMSRGRREEEEEQGADD